MPGLALPWLALLAAVPARGAGPPPLDAFFAGARVGSVAISPDAHYISLVVTLEGRSFVAVKDLVRKGAITPVVAVRDKERMYPSRCGWANATRLLCSYRGLDAIMGKHFPITRLIAVNADGKDAKVLANSRTTWSQFQDGIIDWTPADPRTVLIELDASDENSLGGTATMLGGGPDGYPDVYALDVYTGRTQRVVRQRTPIQSFATDGHGNVRLGYGARDAQRLFFGRLDGERPWLELARVEAYAGANTFKPVAAIAGSNFAYAMRDYAGRDALWKVDLTDATDPQLVFAHPDVDLDEPLFTHDQRLLGVAFETDRPGVYYTDPDAARAYDAIRRALPGRLNRIVDMTPDAKTFVVHSESDVAAPLYFVLDLHESPARLEAVAAAGPGLADSELASMQPIAYAARDGTQIPGYLTLPVRAPAAGKPPLIVMPHGGPYARDSWGYDPWVQFLASHGYAVLQMEFRGSTGYGTKWFEAGFRDWGGLPYDDVIDATRWALAQGHGDPARTCIVGGSFGGYMALLAATRNDGLFRCAVSIAGVSDLIELRRDQWNFRNAELAIAGLASDTAKLKADSPRNHADGVDIPVLLIHGDDDYTVEVDHTTMMATALRRAGKEHEVLIIKDTDHYFREDSARRALFGTLGRFLDAQLGGKPP
jgi:dipeptidyl aminopeptidase/acylaminoacyl peptidase